MRRHLSFQLWGLEFESWRQTLPCGICMFTPCWHVFFFPGNMPSLLHSKNISFIEDSKWSVGVNVNKNGCYLYVSSVCANWLIVVDSWSRTDSATIGSGSLLTLVKLSGKVNGRTTHKLLYKDEAGTDDILLHTTWLPERDFFQSLVYWVGITPWHFSCRYISTSIDE